MSMCQAASAYISRLNILIVGVLELWLIKLFLSVQYYAWTEYKFTCVCMCPSHFMSTRLMSDPSTDFYS